MTTSTGGDGLAGLTLRQRTPVSGRGRAADLPPGLQTYLQTAEASGTVMSIALDDAVAAYEKDLLQDALKSARGNRAKAARLLRTTERIVNYKVRKLGIDWKRFKA